MTRRFPHVSTIRSAVEILLLFALLTFLWGYVAQHAKWDPAFVATPQTMVRALWESRINLCIDSWHTLRWLAAGFVLTTVVALGVGIGLHLMPGAWSRPIYGTVVILQCVPVFALTASIVYAGQKYWPNYSDTLTRIIMIFLVAFFPVLVSTMDGLRNIDDDLVDLFGSMRATRLQKLFVLEIPSALYMVFTGLKVTLTLCAIGEVIAEMQVGEMKGLGYRAEAAGRNYNVALAYASVLVLGATVGILYWLLSTLVERIATIKKVGNVMLRAFHKALVLVRKRRIHMEGE